MRKKIWPEFPDKKLYDITFLREGGLYAVSAEFVCEKDPHNRKRKAYLKKRFKDYRQARVFLSKAIRHYGFPNYLELHGLQNGNEETIVNFLTKKCTFPRESLEFIRQDRKIHYFRLWASEERKSRITIRATYTTALCVFNRYWTFGADEVEKAAEVWQRLEHALGQPVEGNFFGFKFKEVGQ